MSKIEEKIDRAAREYAYNSYEAFRAGANWALSHQWRSVEDALPFHDTEVVVATEDDDYYYRAIAWYSPTESKWYSNDKLLDKSKIKYWMPIPKFKMKQ